jgi:putative addiction module component (TIGR02574 family)
MSIAELRNLPRSEKLKIIEALWEDLSSDSDALESPVWHTAELDSTVRDFEEGKIEVLEWDDAKRQLLDKRR